MRSSSSISTEPTRLASSTPVYTLAICLQFAFAARMSEIIALKWEWIEFDERRVVWPDSKTGDISKPLSDEAYDLL